MLTFQVRCAGGEPRGVGTPVWALLFYYPESLPFQECQRQSMRAHFQMDLQPPLSHKGTNVQSRAQPLPSHDDQRQTAGPSFSPGPSVLYLLILYLKALRWSHLLQEAFSDCFTQGVPIHAQSSARFSPGPLGESDQPAPSQSSTWPSRHNWHRTGHTADINKHPSEGHRGGPRGVQCPCAGCPEPVGQPAVRRELPDPGPER